MSGSIQTDIDRPLPNEDDRELARRYLKRKGLDDLIPILGLDDAPIKSSRRIRGKPVYWPNMARPPAPVKAKPRGEPGGYFLD